MKIAFVALPHPEDPIVTPPLPIGYLAALLEQQRHIVRIYDLALHNLASVADALAPLRAFRPHITVVAATDPAVLTAIETALAGCPCAIMPLGVDLRIATPGQAMTQALWGIDRQTTAQDEQSVIYEALLGLDDDLDTLPFPARHLLPLEQYPLFTPAGDLQTTILIGQQFDADSLIPRHPAQIITETRSISREYGIRHFVFTGPLLSADLAWMHELLQHLEASDIGNWEVSIDYRSISAELAHLCRRAGCEVLCFPLDGTEVLGSKSARAELLAAVEHAHNAGIAVRANIYLDPGYSAMPVLVDLAATFELDDVRFSVAQAELANAHTSDDLPLENVAEMVQSRYRSSRSRQFFIERFGPRMGPMLWRVGRAGLLGRTWQRYADGGEDNGTAVARGYGV